jgi:hypothetical protein
VQVLVAATRSDETSAATTPSLEQLYGICSDDLIVLDEQGISETLDETMEFAAPQTESRRKSEKVTKATHPC